MSEDLTQPIITEQRKTPIVPILFTIFQVVLISIAGLFGYQNFLMHKQIAKLSIQPVPTLIPTIPADSISNWKTYKIVHDLKFGFSDYEIKLPESWKIQEHSSNFQNSETFTYTKPTSQLASGDFTPGMAWLMINISESPISQIVESDENKKSASKVVINGLEFTKLNGYGGVGGSVYYSNFITSYKGKTYQISFSTQDEEIKYQMLRDIDQILSTFKFIEPAVSPTPQISYVRPEISDTSSWKVYTLKNIQFKAPEEARVSITDGDAVITLPEAMIPSANVMLRAYDGGPRREWWIKEINATPDEVSKYMRFQDVMLGKVAALDVFGDGGWWQGGYASPILIAKGKTIIAIHGGRGLNPETGKTSRYIFSDSVASTIKFIQ